MQDLDWPFNPQPGLCHFIQSSPGIREKHSTNLRLIVLIHSTFFREGHVICFVSVWLLFTIVMFASNFVLFDNLIFFNVKLAYMYWCFLILTLKIQFGLEWSFYTKNVCNSWVATQQKHTKNVDNLDYNNIEYNTKKESNLQKSQSFRLQFLKKTFNFFIFNLKS